MGKFTAQVKGGLHANYASSLPSIEPYNGFMDHKHTAQSLAHKGDFEARAITDALIGAAPGATALYNYTEIEANQEMGGRRNIVTTALVNRATTAQDVSDVKETITSLSSDTFVPNPPYNGDRNPLGTR